ncbi:MAG: peroxidase family protein [Gammaproteobacteria bacterium]
MVGKLLSELLYFEKNSMFGVQARALAIFLSLQVLAAPVSAMIIRSYDGTANNQTNADWGAADSALLRLGPVAYADGLSAPRGDIPTTLPSARAVSEAVSSQSGPTRNRRGASDWLWQWGQFVDHDLDLTGQSGSASEAFDVQVPLGDPSFDPLRTGSQVIPLQRSEYTVDQNGVRQQTNQITAYIDASNVYGSDNTRAALLRDNEKYLRMTVGATGEILLGQNTLNAPNDNGGSPNNAEFFLAGDIRANEQIGLTAVHTLFAREHNRLVDELKSRLDAGDASLIAERDATIGMPDNGVDTESAFLYEAARKIVGAQIQKITYGEFLPVLVGADLTSMYSGYDDEMNAGISNEFSTAAFRLGHTMLPSSLLRISHSGGSQVVTEIALREAFFNPDEVFNNGVDSLLMGLTARKAQAVDTLLVDDVRNFLFGPPGSGGLDLASLNIQRGRDHGLGSLNAVRGALGLGAHSDFLDLTGGDTMLARALAALYGDINEVDLWIGGLAESAFGDSMLGETFTEILVDQFMRSMLGDRFFYLGEEMRTLNILSPEFMSETSLSRIIQRNTSVNSIQANVFLTVPEPATIVLMLVAGIALVRARAPQPSRQRFYI